MEQTMTPDKDVLPADLPAPIATASSPPARGVGRPRGSRYGAKHSADGTPATTRPDGLIRAEFAVWLTTEQMRRVDHVTEHLGLSRSALGRLAILEYLSRHSALAPIPSDDSMG